MEYLVVKWLHIITSTILFGAGVASAFHMVLAAIGRDVRDIAGTTRHAVVQDWVFTAPSVVVQPLSGLWMMNLAGIPLATPWIRGSLLLYAVAIGCWVLVVWIQLRLRALADAAARADAALPRSWWGWFTAWVVLGVTGFAAFLAIFWLMVAKRMPFEG